MTITTNRMRLLGLMAAGLLLPALAGCSRSEPEQQPSYGMENDAGVTETVPETEAPAPINDTDMQPAMRNMAAEAPPPPPPPPARSVDQQMMDDASVTGMTARVSRDHGDTGMAPVESVANEQ
ncbi:hypothetical protein RN629_07845 [Sphingomonadaceae bacterium jetA1]|jgi:uncharacterized lipoprotein|uniref:hypothetical protein n=1 Tax=Facivitalis istanbulensis TaxID=3075838 RepID=UPI00346FD17D